MEETGRRSFLAGIGSLAAGIGIGTMAVGATGSGASPDREVVVGTPPSRSLTETSSRIQSAPAVPDDAEVVHRNETLGYVVLRLPATSSVSRESVLASLEARTDVDYVEPNLQYELIEPVSSSAVASEPRFDDQYGPQTVRAPQAWEEVSDSSSVTVAVIDTGADYEHEDLTAQYSGDPGKDFVDDDGDPAPDDSSEEHHGTHVSGIVAGVRDNDTGISGVSDASLLNGRVLDESGYYDRFEGVQDLADAIQWATDQGADIVNMSLRSPRGSPHSTVHDAIKYATDNGTLVVVAAGNDGNDEIIYPARYDEVLAVSASDRNDEFVDNWTGRDYGSNYGPNVDVCAPGKKVLSTVPGGYEKFSGTSMASPTAAGVAALGLAADPGLSPAELRARVKSTAVDIGEPENKQGAGRVDAKNLVDSLDGGGPGKFPELDGHPFEDEIRTLIDEDVVAGYPDGTFRPEKELTRAEFASMVVEAFDPEPSSKPDFSDIDGHWAEAKIRQSAGADFFGGYPDGTFRPDANVRKVEVLVALDSGLGYAEGNPDDLRMAYDDADAIPGWARQAVADAHTAWGGIENYPDQKELEPMRDATRAEAAKYVYEASRDTTSVDTGEHTETMGGTVDAGSTVVHEYALQSTDPSLVRIALSGPDDEDFDLYATLDGRTPTRSDYDRRSWSFGSDEAIAIEGDALSADATLGILVTAYSGGGDYELEIVETSD